MKYLNGNENPIAQIVMQGLAFYIFPKDIIRLYGQEILQAKGDLRIVTEKHADELFQRHKHADEIDYKFAYFGFRPIQ